MTTRILRTLLSAFLPLTLASGAAAAGPRAGPEPSRLDAVTAAVGRMLAEPPEGLMLCSVWPAERLSHNTGAGVADPEAHDRVAWQAVPGKHRGDTHVAWGPYEELPPGRYAAAFRLKIEPRGEAPLVRLDVFDFRLSQEGKDGTCAQRTLRTGDLKAPGRYADYWLDFEHGRTGKLEYRVWWPGHSPLSLDRVVVFRKP
jgi:hypothetical protein